MNVVKKLQKLLNENLKVVMTVLVLVSLVVLFNFSPELQNLLQKGDDALDQVSDAVQEVVPSLTCSGKKLPKVEDETSAADSPKPKDEKLDEDVKAFDGSWAEASTV